MEIQQHLLGVQMIVKSMSGVELAREWISVLSEGSDSTLRSRTVFTVILIVIT